MLTWRLGDIARQARVHGGKIEVDSASPTVAVASLVLRVVGYLPP